MSRIQMAVADESYDVNFCFPVPQRIESARVALTPFNPVLHGKAFHCQATLYPEIFNCFPFGPFKTMSEFDDFVENTVRSNAGFMLFCVWDKTKQSASSESLLSASTASSVSSTSPLSKDDNGNGALAGLIGLINSSRETLATEIGLVLILPPFHRTHVASNAVGLLLQYALETSTPHSSPSIPFHNPTANSNAPSERHCNIFTITNGPSLGLRRVAWQASERNAASIRLAERMGFKFEAVQRWGRVLPVGRPSDIGLRVDDPKATAGGLNAAMLSLCWDDWEGGAMDKVQLIMQRTH